MFNAKMSTQPQDNTPFRMEFTHHTSGRSGSGGGPGGSDGTGPFSTRGKLNPHSAPTGALATQTMAQVVNRTHLTPIIVRCLVEKDAKVRQEKCKAYFKTFLSSIFSLLFFCIL